MGTQNCISSDCTSNLIIFDPTYYIDPDEIDIDTIDFSLFYDNLQEYIEKEFLNFYTTIENDLINNNIYTLVSENNEQLGDNSHPFYSIFKIDIISVEYENKILFNDCIFNFGELEPFYIGLRNCYYSGVTFDYIWEKSEDCDFSYYDSYIDEDPIFFIEELVSSNNEICIDNLSQKIKKDKKFLQ